MADELMVEIVTPEKMAFSGKVEEITIPGIEGEFGVLKGHASLLSAIKFGELSYLRDGRRTHYAVNMGYAEVTASKVTILVESAERADQIDVDRAKRAKEKAEQKLSKMAKEDAEYGKIEADLHRAEIRIKIAQHEG
jgi:F-type H+-transporting ATPase subunit epsilon